MLEVIYWIAGALELAIGWVFSSSWLPPEDFRFFRWLVVPGYGYGFVLITFALLELIIPQDRRPWNRATLLTATYLMFAGKIGIYILVVTPLIRDTWLYLGLPSLHLDPTPTATTVHDRVRIDSDVQCLLGTSSYASRSFVLANSQDSSFSAEPKLQ